MKSILFAFLILLISFTGTAQTFNSNSGGYNTGYGHMYGSFGMAMATQSMFNQMQMLQQQNMMRAVLEKKHGKAAVARAEAEARSGAKPSLPVTPRPAPKYHGRFKPDATVNTGKLLGDALGSTPEEKALYDQIYKTVKAGYDKEAAAKGWQNNMAGAFTFFIVSNATVYHDAGEPSEEAVNALYETVNQTFDEIPEFGKMPNKDKQAFNNMLIAFAAIPLATYSEAKQNGDAETLKVARQLAGQLLEIVLKTDPEKIRFENGEVKFGSMLPGRKDWRAFDLPRPGSRRAE